MKGVVNLRYTVDGKRFDAAIDYGKVLHYYPGDVSTTLPVELYCLDRTDWDIHMMFIPQNSKDGAFVEMDDIIKETRDWMGALLNDDNENVEEQ